MHAAKTLFEQQIKESQKRLKVDEPLELHSFVPFRGNVLVQLKPFFYLPQEIVETIRREFRPFKFTPKFVAQWIYQFIGQKKGEKPYVSAFLDCFKKVARKDLILVRKGFRELGSGIDDDELKKMARDFIAMIDRYDKPLKIEGLPVFYSGEEAEKKLKRSGLPSFFQKGELSEELEGTLTPYHFSLDLLLLNQSHKSLWKLIERYEKKFGDPRGFNLIFKAGPENEREQLMASLAETLGLKGYLLGKENVTLNHVKIRDEKNPTGLLCSFIDNELDYNWRRLMTRYTVYGAHARRFFLQSQKQSKAKRWQERAERSQKQIEALNLKESIEGNLLLDLIFGSYDSHFSQYKVLDGQLVNLDFSRFALPCETYVIEERTYTALCSSLLDAPGLDQPLSSRLQTLIQHLDLEAVRDAFQPFVGEAKAFAQATYWMKLLRADMLALLVTPDHLVPLKYSLHCKAEGETPSIAEQRKELSAKFKRQAAEIKKKFYQQIHPEAFALIMKRLTLLKSLQNPSIQTIFAALYPDFVPFTDLLKRMHGFSGMSLAFKRGKKSLEAVSLEEILSRAAVKFGFKEAIPLLQPKIEALRLKSHQQADIALMGEMYF